MSNSPIREIDITVDQSITLSTSESWLHMVMEQALHEALPPDQPGQVSLLITDDTTVQGLNRKYRGLDEVTDVLSFSAEFPGHWEGDQATAGNAAGDDLNLADVAFILPPDEVPPLGEVIISHPQTQRQASEKSVDLDRELALLMVHGVLHLMGHDHLEAVDTALMQSKEQAALQAIFPIGVTSL